MVDAILVIKGDRDCLIQIRKQINHADSNCKTSNVIFHEDRLNPHVPDLKDGYARFDKLLTRALRGPKIMKMRRKS